MGYGAGGEAFHGYFCAAARECRAHYHRHPALLQHQPQGLQADRLPGEVVEAARDAWDRALALEAKNIS